MGKVRAVRVDGLPWNATQIERSKYRADRARRLYRLGVAVPEIAARLEISRKQVKRYLGGEHG